MHKFVRNLITEWRLLKLPTAGETIVVAVSGGADSCALLLGVHDLVKRKKLDHRIVVAHLNHGLRETESDGDEAFVRELSERLEVEFISENATLPTQGNLEQSARHARLEFFNRVAKDEGAYAVLVGHTMDDQAETFLMNLIRGAGPDGLSGMQSVRRASQALNIVRPLLSWCRRADTENFCGEFGVSFRNDSMNDNLAFRRVRIRRQVIPILAGMNPKIVETLSATAKLMITTSSGVTAPETLSIRELTSLDLPARIQRIREWLAGRRGNTRALGLKHIQAVERLAFSSKSGRVVELPGKATVTRSGGALTYRSELG